MNEAPDYCELDIALHRKLVKQDRRMLRLIQALAAAMVIALICMISGGILTVKAIQSEHKAQLEILKAYMEKKNKCADVQKLFTLADHR